MEDVYYHKIRACPEGKHVRIKPYLPVALYTECIKLNKLKQMS